MAELVETPIDVAALILAGSRPECGALAVFLGTTRDHHQGRRVATLSYEAYQPMALQALAAVEREAERRFAVARCLIVHRLGVVPPTAASVVVVVAAAHRGPAFDACRWAMDELKRAVPIWKKEQYVDGGANWVPGHSLGDAKA